MVRIPEDLTGTYWSGDQMATVSPDHILFTIVDEYGRPVARVYAPIGSGDPRQPFAQMTHNGLVVVKVNQDPGKAHRYHRGVGTIRGGRGPPSYLRIINKMLMCSSWRISVTKQASLRNFSTGPSRAGRK